MPTYFRELFIGYKVKYIALPRSLIPDTGLAALFKIQQECVRSKVIRKNLEEGEEK